MQQQQEQDAYEAALEARRQQVEAERLRRDMEQLKLVSALSRMSEPLPGMPCQPWQASLHALTAFGMASDMQTTCRRAASSFTWGNQPTANLSCI